MDLQFHGANCITITSGNARVVVDDNLADMGGKGVIKSGDIALFTSAHPPVDDTKLTIGQPGEYEVSDLSIHGIPLQAHIDEAKQRTSTVYKLIAHDIRLLVLGHIHPDLSDDDLERIGTIDVMTIPVGGNGFTLDATGAVSVIKKIEPKLVIPTYYADNKLHFSVPAQTLEDALHGLGIEPKEEHPTKLKIKPSELSDTLQLVVLEKS